MIYLIQKIHKEFGILFLHHLFQMTKNHLQIGCIKLMMYVNLIKELVLDMKI